MITLSDRIVRKMVAELSVLSPPVLAKISDKTTGLV